MADATEYDDPAENPISADHVCPLLSMYEGPPALIRTGEAPGDEVGGVRLMTAVPDAVGSAALLATTVTCWLPDTIAGAVYNPVVEMLPAPPVSDHVTPPVVVPVTTALNCWVCDAPSVAVAGTTATATDVRGRISIALTFGLSIPGTNWMTTCPLATLTGKLRSTARSGPPAAATMSNPDATVCPLMAMLNCRCPGWLK